MSTISLSGLSDFLLPIDTMRLSGDEGFRQTQLGKHILANEGELPELQDVDLILVGCGDSRGAFGAKIDDDTPNAIREQFYRLYQWHDDIKVADLGNIKSGLTMQDTYAALTAVLKEIIPSGKKVVILGGSHDLTTAQYDAYASLGKIIEAVCVDARIDVDMDSPLPIDNFLLPMFTREPNFLKQYNHIGFQSYMVHPGMLQTIDKLGFDCFRVGKVKENMEEMEPIIRASNMMSFDIAAIEHAHAPANTFTPNGFNGEEACSLLQYAGLSTHASTVGIYGYKQEEDHHEMTAKQISHMLWYLMDGMHQAKEEQPITHSEHFNHFHLCFAEMDSTFLQSRITGRWWMEIPEAGYIPCSKTDYMQAANNEIPERWFRAIERL